MSWSLLSAAGDGLDRDEDIALGAEAAGAGGQIHRAPRRRSLEAGGADACATIDAVRPAVTKDRVVAGPAVDAIVPAAATDRRRCRPLRTGHPCRRSLSTVRGLMDVLKTKSALLRLPRTVFLMRMLSVSTVPHCLKPRVRTTSLPSRTMKAQGRLPISAMLREERSILSPLVLKSTIVSISNWRSL